MNKPTFTHLLNPISRATNKELFETQNLTLKSLKIALQDAAAANIYIEPLFVLYDEDRYEFINGYTKYALIVNSVLDHGNFSYPRKLPLLQELLDAAYANSTAEYLIFTNIDICLLPFFYRSITNIVLSGTHSFTITRRTIPQPAGRNYYLSSLFAEIGEPHRGWDTFIFPRKYVPNLKLKNLCVGAPLVGLGLVANLLAQDANFEEFRQFHLTFHIGNDRHWNDPINREYTKHNKAELMYCLKELEAQHGEFPIGSPPYKYLRLHRNFITSTLYDWFSGHFHIPARYLRR